MPPARPCPRRSPLLISEHFGGGALELSWIHSAFGLGMLAGGITLSVWGGFKRRIVTAYLGQILGGICSVVMGLLQASGFPLAVVTAFFMGFMNPIVNGSSMAVLQANIPSQMQGRVFTLFMSVTGITTPLGLAIAGPVGDTLGVQPWFLIAGIVTSVTGLCALLIPAIIQFEDRETQMVEKPLPASA